MSRSRQWCNSCNRRWLKVDHIVKDNSTQAYYTCACGYKSEPGRKVISFIAPHDAVALRELIKSCRFAYDHHINGHEAEFRYYFTEMFQKLNNMNPDLSRKIWGPPD